MTKNMTEGHPLKLIMMFALPLLLGNIFQQTYNIVDTAIVGQTLGANALAAVGSTTSVQFLVLGFVYAVGLVFLLPSHLVEITYLRCVILFIIASFLQLSLAQY